MTPHWPGLAGNASRSSARPASWWTNMSAWAAGGRVDAAAAGLLGHGLPHLVLGDAAGERIARRAPAPCAGAAAAPRCASAAANVAERRRQRPASTQLTGIGVTDAAASSTVRLRIRFCFAPTSSSPS